MKMAGYMCIFQKIAAIILDILAFGAENVLSNSFRMLISELCMPVIVLNISTDQRAV